MFWRIVGRLLTANYGRLFLILLALGAGAAVTAALLNLQMDAKRRLTTEFRALGANVIVAPRDFDQRVSGATLPQTLFDQVPVKYNGGTVAKAAFLYFIATATGADKLGKPLASPASSPVIVAGVRTVAENIAQVVPHHVIEGQNSPVSDAAACEIGQRVASQLHVHVADHLELHTDQADVSCLVSQVRAFGGAEDNQVFLPLETAQKLTGLAGRISLIQASVPGTPAQIAGYVKELAQVLPNADVHGIRQFTEGEGRIYNRISGMLTFTVVLVLLLTSLCVMAGMSNVAIERKNDVGLMKAIGGSVRRVVDLFLAEAILMGIASGIVGSLIGILISIYLGKAVFGVAAQPRWIVYPFSVVLTIIVSIASAFPLRRLAGIRPASVFRGEE